MNATLLLPYFLGIGANLCFGTASLAFSRFSISHSPRWMNQLKVSIAFLGFLIAFYFCESFTHLTWLAHSYLIFSGFLGLCLGDLFLFRSFASLGPARTFVLYSFQPLLLGIYGYLALGQQFNLYQLASVSCMIFCVIVFVLERNKLLGKFDIHSFGFAFLGMLFDAIGVMLSRQAYESDANLGSFQVNTTRALGALIGFFILAPRSYRLLFHDVKAMKSKEKSLAIGASLLGTFVSLSLYLRALKTANVASLTAISITLPIWVSLIEHIQKKEWPNRYLWAAFVLFLLGFAFMNFSLDFSR